MFQKAILSGLIAATLSLSSLQAHDHGDKAGAVYTIDTVHSGVSFKIRHLLTRVPGSFGKFEGFAKVPGDDWSKAYVEAKIDLRSVDTNNADRDKHLQQDDYFNTAQHPMMTFKSTKWVPVQGKEGHFTIHGELTMNGKTLPVEFAAEFLGKKTNPRNQQTALAFTASGEIDRTDWDVDGGQGVVGNDVDFEIDVALYAKQA
ncbi:MAG: YceI family protein [Opitutales bacterium]